MSLNINFKGGSTPVVKTKKDNIVTEMVRKYPTLYKYYDDMVGTACVSVEEYNRNEKLQDEIYDLLKTPQFKCEKLNIYMNWALEVRLISDPETEEMVDGVIIRTVESY